MSSNSEYAEGLVLINGQAYPVKEVLQALERQAMTSLRTVGDELWIGKDRIRPLAKTSPDQAMKLTCYGSLAYCCDLTRDCYLRDQALDLLGISKEEYRALQRECHQQFLRYGERRWPQDQYGSSSSDYSRSPVYPESLSHRESQDSWRERSSSRSYQQSRDPTHSASSGSSSSVDLGGLFGTPEEYNSRSLTDPKPFASLASRIGSNSNSFSSEGWLSSGSSAIDASPTHVLTPGFCIYCGQDLQEDSEFCSRCGRGQK